MCTMVMFMCVQWPNGRAYKMLIIVRIFLLLTTVTVVFSMAADTSREEIICSNIDIRNSVKNFKKLENCTVVEGFLQILLIDNGLPKDYENLSFPHLKEISGYLLLYRAYGLQSLGKLFPNLAVIRGSVLFHNYALVVFEMFQLHEIGLYSLTDILRGSVRIEKNPNLCYVSTIDWDRIAKTGRGGHFIKENKRIEQCPNTCPSNGYCYINGKFGKSGLCWNSHHCQKVCPMECDQQNFTCTRHSRCCNAECLGGCTGPSPSDCVACRHVVYQGRCMRTCPPNVYKYLDRRCITEDVCRGMTQVLPHYSLAQTIYWKPFQKECLPECPYGYTESEIDKHKCIKCQNRCPKVCPGAIVDSVAAAQNLHGCTYINGSLEIQIQGGTNVIRELEENLSLIQEIKGYLKVARSFPLISLNFLRDLKIIHGEQLDKKDYALLVLDNQNLQELWNWQSRKTRLRIGGGKIFFHFNSKLCPSKIRELKKYTDVADWDDRDVSPSSNGDRVACDVTSINVSVWQVGSTLAGLVWKNFKKSLPDQRSLLGYVIYYREAPFRNITIYDGRDACGADMWKVDDVEATDNDDDDDQVWYLMTHLKPFTTYAFYVRTYTIASAMHGAQSPIIYFKTKPDIPTQPTSVRAHATAHSEIVVSWKEPKRPNGNVTHYIIEGVREVDSSEFINQRNYCSEPLTLPDLKKPTGIDDSSRTRHQWLPNNTTDEKFAGKNKCCSCSKDRPVLEDEEEDAEFQIHFEDFLHNSVYIKNPASSKRRRERNTQEISNVPYRYTHRNLLSNSASTTASVSNAEVSTPSSNNETNAEDKVFIKFQRIVYNSAFVIISDLHHFAEYTIEVTACQDKPEDTKHDMCSSKAITTVRTFSLKGADDIDSSSVMVQHENLTAGTVLVKWDEPSDPNGLIVSYHIESKRVNRDDYRRTECITRLEYQRRMGHVLVGLHAGNYSIQVRATSLADNGNWTVPVFFYIPEHKDGLTSEVLAAVIVATALAAIVLIALTTWIFLKRKFGPRVPDGILYASVNPEYMSAGLVYEPDEWEIDREKITLLHELGQGSFGMVYEGEARDLEEEKKLMRCAVKTVNESASLRERIEFLQEASVMKAFSCHHVVKLLGVVSKGHPTLVIMELMANGDLKTYLRSHRPESEDNQGFLPPTLKQIFEMAVEIADGMAYLAAKKFVHRDLAARNCMVAEDLTVKIGDFGMTRDIYETDYYRKGGKGLLPVRWMAPESLKDGVFTSQSDVWSYGVVLYEMATLASQPYQGLSNEQVLKYVIGGGIMEKPENCPERIYVLMKMCWSHNQKARPTFTELIETLMPEMNQSKFKEVSFYYTQRAKMTNETVDNTEPASPSTPLKSRIFWEEASLASHENSEDEGDVQYFPSVMAMCNDSDVDAQLQTSSTECDGEHISRQREDSQTERTKTGVHSNEGSKGMSTTSSDGSKGSKVSTVSNGSIANGHVAFPAGRTTMC